MCFSEISNQTKKTSWRSTELDFQFVVCFYDRNSRTRERERREETIVNRSVCGEVCLDGLLVVGNDGLMLLYGLVAVNFYLHGVFSDFVLLLTYRELPIVLEDQVE